MDAIIQFCQPLFQPVVLVFTVLNLLSMGLQVNLGSMFKVVRNPKFLGLMLVLGWVIGPAIAYLITLLLPLDNSYIIVLFIGSLAPCAPFLPPLIPKAQGDVNLRRSLHTGSSDLHILANAGYSTNAGQGDRFERDVAS